jgi:hypothetical protein
VVSVLWFILKVAGAALGIYLLWNFYLALVLKWGDERTRGLGYYGLPLKDREAYKRTLRMHARLLGPLLRINSTFSRLDFRTARLLHQGIAFPKGSCDAASCERATSYRPHPEDVFVVTQMKCGTTWMQHVVYEVLRRGNGDLVARGTAMYAVAPWLEGVRSVGVADAPLIGAERPSRIVKTHLPAQLCPSSPSARYIYVARHPVSCFASCVDFVATNVGTLAPDLSAHEKWFCTPDLMWFGTWPDHVSGWWDRAQQDSNVLFVLFEDMKRDLAAVVRKVAAFLGVAPLNDSELAAVVEKCGFAYMQTHQSSFEMHPPHVLQTNAELFVSGRADRHLDVPRESRTRISDWVAREMKGRAFPLAEIYPDVTSRDSAS